MIKWLFDRWQPLASVAGCFVVSLVALLLTKSLIEYLKSDILIIEIGKAPAGVTGPDLIANLLTISALTISGCFTYICLPSDRVELRMATHVKISFIDKLMDEIVFETFCSSLPSDELPPSCRTLRGLLSPRSGLGGWHRLNDKDLMATFGSGEWKTISRFVDKHSDVKWMACLGVWLSIGMALGAADLFLRYLGIMILFFNSYEFYVICLLISLNFTTAIFAISLAVGGTKVEKRARERINTCVEEAKGHVSGWQTLRAQADLTALESGLSKVEDAEPELPLDGAKVVRPVKSTGRTQRSKSGKGTPTAS